MVLTGHPTPTLEEDMVVQPLHDSRAGTPT